MRKALCNFGSGWREKIEVKFSQEELESVKIDGEERTRVFKDFQARSSKSASEKDAQAAQEILENNFRGEYLSAVVIIPSAHGHVCPKEGGRINF
jgi:hypothetical protein